MIARFKSLGIAALLGLIVGYSLGWQIYRRRPAAAEVYAPAVRQADGSTQLERKPDPKAQPKQILPKGAKVERVIQVVARPGLPVEAPPVTTGAPHAAEVAPAAATPCPPVTVDLTLVRMPDDSRRVLASSPDGTLVGGMDIPVEAAKLYPVLRNRGLGGYDPVAMAWVLGYLRKVGPVEVGALVTHSTVETHHYITLAIPF